MRPEVKFGLSGHRNYFAVAPDDERQAEFSIFYANLPRGTTKRTQRWSSGLM